MRRIIIIGTTLTVLVGAAAAYAALNTYHASLSFSGGRGSARSPVPIGYVEHLAANSSTPGNRAAPLIDIKTTIYGLTADPGPFPTCYGPEMSVRKGDSFCPKGALVATGPVKSVLGSSALATPGTPCNPFLHVWNGGHGKLWFFFTTDAQHYCAGLTTGQTAAYPGYISHHGANYVLDVPLPPDVSNQVAGHNNLYGSLISEVLTTRNLRTKVHGRTVGFTSSVACKRGKRPWSVAFTSTSANGKKETRTVSGASHC